MTTENPTHDANPEADVAAAMDALDAGTLAAPDVQPENLDTPATVPPADTGEPATTSPADGAAKPDAAPADQPAADQSTDPAAQHDTADVAPSSWKPDVAAKWADLPAEVKAEIQRRETEYHKGIEQYKPYAQLGQDYERIMAPHMEMVRAAGVTPDVAINHLMGYHRVLTFGTPDQKRDVIARIARDCQIDLQGITPAAPVDPQVQQLMQQNQQLQQFQQNTLQQNQQTVLNQIQEFAQAPGHEHFEVVQHDMSMMLQSGMAQNLQDAYEKAVWARPDLRQSLVEKERTEAEKRATETARRTKAKSAAGSIKGSGSTSSGALPDNASLEDTVAAAVDGLI